MQHIVNKQFKYKKGYFAYIPELQLVWIGPYFSIFLFSCTILYIIYVNT